MTSWSAPNEAPTSMAAAATKAGLVRPTCVMGTPVATMVATGEAKPQTTAGVRANSGTLEVSTMPALPSPTQTAKNRLLPGTNVLESSDAELIRMPVALQASDCLKPRAPPPRMKKEAQAMNVTHTG